MTAMTNETINSVLAALPRSKRAPFIAAVIDLPADDIPAALHAWAQQAAPEPTRSDAHDDCPGEGPELVYRDATTDDDELEAEYGVGDTITVRMYLDGPREISRPKPDGWADMTADQRCEVIDRIKWEIMGNVAAFEIKGTFNRSGYELPCGVSPVRRQHPA